MNTHEFEDRLEAVRLRFHRYCAHDGIGGLLAELRLRPNIVEAALVINLLQTPVCVFRSKLKGVFGLPAVHRPRRPEPLWRLCRRETDAVVHGPQCKRGTARARARDRSEKPRAGKACTAR